MGERGVCDGGGRDMGGGGCGENGALQSAVIRRTCLRPVDYKLLQVGLDLHVLTFANLEYSYKS